jgi:hypothetical protein
MVSVDPGDFRVISNEPVNAACDCSPAYACGLMFVREKEHLACYDLRAQVEGESR